MRKFFKIDGMKFLIGIFFICVLALAIMTSKSPHEFRYARYYDVLYKKDSSHISR